MTRYNSLIVFSVITVFVASACSRDKQTEWTNSTEVCFDGGELKMGSDHHYPEERPVKHVEIEPFCLDRFEVRVADYATFVRATN